MPIWEGVCPTHGQFERLLPQIGHPPAKVRCTQCNRNVPRIPSSASFILKAGGGGFYKPSPKGEDK